MVEVLHIVGLLCSLLSVVLSNVGILIQKWSTEVEAGMPLCRRWRLLLGLVLNIGSEISLSSTAVHLAPLALILITASHFLPSLSASADAFKIHAGRRHINRGTGSGPCT